MKFKLNGNVALTILSGVLTITGTLLELHVNNKKTETLETMVEKEVNRALTELVDNIK